MNLFWNKHYSDNVWFLETARGHVAGEVTQRDGKYYAGHAIPYEQDEDENERDWEPAPEPFDLLHEAVAWVEENARWTVQGEFISFMVVDDSYRHVIYTHNGEVKQAFKKWDFARIESVLERMGATYWEIG